MLTMLAEGVWSVVHRAAFPLLGTSVAAVSRLRLILFPVSGARLLANYLRLFVLQSWWALDCREDSDTMDWWASTMDWWASTMDWWASTMDWWVSTMDWWASTMDFGARTMTTICTGIQNTAPSMR